MTAETYRRVGGLDGWAALEDQAFGVKLARHGVPVVRAADVRVRTSARTDGRARRGLSVDLAVSSWREQRRYEAQAFSLEALRAAKATSRKVVDEWPEVGVKTSSVNPNIQRSACWRRMA